MQPCASPRLDPRIDILVSAEHVASCEQQKGRVTQAQHCTHLFGWCYLGLPAILCYTKHITEQVYQPCS